MSFLTTLSSPLRRLAYTWIVLAGIVFLICISVFVLGTSWESHISSIKYEELQNTPQVQQQLNQMRRQGAPESHIETQLRAHIAQNEMPPIMENLRAAARRTAFIILLITAALYLLLIPQNNAPIPPLYVRAALVIILLAELMFVASRYVLVQETASLLARPGAIEWLSQREEPARVAVLDQARYQEWIGHHFTLHGIETIHIPADSRISPVRQLFFYSNQISPLRRWQYANVRYLLAERQQMRALLRQWNIADRVTEEMRFSHYGQEHAIFTYHDALPRVFAVGSWLVTNDFETTLAVMNAPSTDPHTTAIVNDSSVSPHTNHAFTGDVHITHYQPERITADVSLSATGLVILATEPYPGWHATINGVTTTLFRCNLVHQGILVPPGTHTVTYSFFASSPFIRLNKYAYSAIPLFILITCASWFITRHARTRTQQQ